MMGWHVHSKRQTPFQGPDLEGNSKTTSRNASKPVTIGHAPIPMPRHTVLSVRNLIQGSLVCARKHGKKGLSSKDHHHYHGAGVQALRTLPGCLFEGIADCALSCTRQVTRDREAGRIRRAAMRRSRMQDHGLLSKRTVHDEAEDARMRSRRYRQRRWRRRRRRRIGGGSSRGRKARRG